MTENRSFPLGLGIVILFTVFLVLILTVFSALTLSSAKGDLALSERAAEYTSAYYSADTAAVEAMADFLAGSDTELETAFPIGDLQSLEIHLIKSGDTVTILRWQVCYTGESPSDPTLPVWQGDF